MNSRQRRAQIRRRPAPGTPVVIFDRYLRRHFDGVVSANQFFTQPTHVRVDYDNGSYRTWDYVPTCEVTA